MSSSNSVSLKNAIRAMQFTGTNAADVSEFTGGKYEAHGNQRLFLECGACGVVTEIDPGTWILFVPWSPVPYQHVSNDVMRAAFVIDQRALPLAEALAKVKLQADEIAKRDKDLPWTMEKDLKRILHDAAMMDVFAREDPIIWPIEIREHVLRKDENVPFKMYGYMPASELARELKKLRALVLRAAAEADAAAWETTNDVAIFATLRSIEADITKLIVDLDTHIRDLQEKQEGAENRAEDREECV